MSVVKTTERPARVACGAVPESTISRIGPMAMIGMQYVASTTLSSAFFEQGHLDEGKGQADGDEVAPQKTL